jgi:hypothetical protein
MQPTSNQFAYNLEPVQNIAALRLVVVRPGNTPVLINLVY